MGGKRRDKSMRESGEGDSVPPNTLFLCSSFLVISHKRGLVFFSFLLCLF